MRSEWILDGRRSVRITGLVAAMVAGSTPGCGGENASIVVADAGAQPDGDAASEVGAGEAGDAGEAGESGEGSEAAATDGGGASDAAPPKYGLFVASDYDHVAKLAVVDLTANTVQGTVLSVPATWGDVTPYASGGRGFLLEGLDGKVLALDPAQPWSVARTIHVSDDVDAEAGGLPVNPHAVVVSSPSKAYVVRYGSNAVLVVDPATGDLKGRIDLSPLVGAGDPDGLVEASDGVFDPATNRVYLLLQRIDQTNQGLDPDRVSQCLAFGPLIVAIDAAKDMLVDLPRGDAAAPGLALLGQNPGALVPDLANGRLLVVESGCYEAPDGGVDVDAGASYPRRQRGIEAVRLSDGSSTWLYEHAQPDRLAGLIWVDGARAFVERTDSAYANHWYAWNPAQPTLGEEIAGFPDFGRYDDGRVIGLATTFADGGSILSVVSLDVGSRQVSTLVADAFGDSTLNAYGTALLH